MSKSRCTVARCRCQAPTILGLRTVSKVSQVWLASAASGENAHTVDDTGKRGQVSVDAFQHRIYCGGVGHVRQLNLDPYTSLAQSIDGFLRFRIGGTATVEHDDARALVCEPLRKGTSDTAQPSGHQVGAVRPQLTSHQRLGGEDDFPDVTGGTHEAQMRLRLRPGAIECGAEVSALRRRPAP